MKQYKIFADNEADNFFLRNQSYIENQKTEDDICFQTIKSVLPLEQIHSVIELGAYNGFRLHNLKKILPNCTRIIGTDLSKMAVEDGRKKFNLEMHHAPIEDFLPNETFDLVIIHSVLHWVDRDNLYKSVYNIDKMLSAEGFLVIGDFDPFYPQKNIYHHITDQQVYTYKQDYSQIFLAGNTYNLLHKVYYCENFSQQIPPDERIAKTMSHNERKSVAILQKNHSKYYAS